MFYVTYKNIRSLTHFPFRSKEFSSGCHVSKIWTKTPIQFLTNKIPKKAYKQMAAVCLGFHPSFTMKDRRGRRWWTCPDINVCILIHCALLTLRARSTGNFMEWILWASQKDNTLQAHLCLQRNSLAPKRRTIQILSLYSISNHHISTPRYLFNSL